MKHVAAQSAKEAWNQGLQVASEQRALRIGKAVVAPALLLVKDVCVSTRCAGKVRCMLSMSCTELFKASTMRCCAVAKGVPVTNTAMQLWIVDSELANMRGRGIRRWRPSGPVAQ